MLRRRMGHLVHIGLLPSSYHFSLTLGSFLLRWLVEGKNKTFFILQFRKKNNCCLYFDFFLQKGNFLNISSCHSDIYPFLIGKHSWNKSPKRIRFIFLVDLGLSQNRQLQLMTLLTIKISVYQRMKTPTKLYIGTDSNWMNPCHQ